MKKLAYHLATLLKNNSDHPASVAVIQFGIEGFLNTLVTTFVLIFASIVTGQSIPVLSHFRVQRITNVYRRSSSKKQSRMYNCLGFNASRM